MLVKIVGKRYEEKIITTSLEVAETFTYYDEEKGEHYHKRT